MRAGELRHQVILQTPTPTRDSYGAEIVTWTDTATVWASIEPLRGREYWEAQKINAEISHKIRMRYREGVKPNMRLKFGSRIFEIISVFSPEERRRELWYLCKERVF